MDKKIAVYICGGCKIGEAIDFEKPSKIATGECKAVLCRTSPYLCGEEASQQIRKDIEEGINTVVIAACSPRVKFDIFNYENSVYLERVNLREHVAWCHISKDEDTQALAEDYLRMGIVKATKATPPEPYKGDVSKAILVVGGGVAGVTSALEAAKAGYSVYLVEKESALGGYAAKLYKQFLQKQPYRELETPGIDALMKEAEQNSNIRIFTGIEIKKISGAPGMFNVTLSQGDVLRVGAIVQATGFRPYDASKLEYLGYGKYPDVITGYQMEEMAKQNKIRCPSNGKDVKSVAFIQCAGQRDKNHLSYCSAVCCLNSLKQALYVKEQNPDAMVFIIYKDIRTPAQYEDFYRRVQEEEGIFFIKGEISSVSGGSGKMLVNVDNTLLGEKVAIEADVVVLATGMVSNSMPEEEKKDACAQDSGFYAMQALNLSYRQGPELPILEYGLPDSHFICFPYETRRTGIYAAGCLRQPMDIASAILDGTGAALKAIQCVELTARGKSVHPRTWDQSYPNLTMQRCTQCKRCTEECPFGMYDEDNKFNPLPTPTRCRRCGICMGSCPERIISFSDYSVDIIGSMIKSMEIPEEEKPRILAFLCENDAYPALDIAGVKGLKYNPFVRVIPVRCLGSVNIIWIADALSQGIDGVLMIGCKYGDDYQCHYIKGSELANYRIEKVQETLQRMALESERVQVQQLSLDEYDRLPRIFDDFVKTIEKIGLNPYRGF